MPRGRLRIYLGMAPGVGKTYAMLGEGHRRASRGTDVVIGYVSDYDRPLTKQMTEGLPAVPPKSITHDGQTYLEMDLDALLTRKPKVALVDEIAHINAPGSRNERRWQDIDELVDAGVDVISTVDIAHLESLSDVVEQITGVRQRETVPDAVVRKADQIELVDMSPEALRRRMAHGNIYPPEKIDAHLAKYFRVGNLTALRELSLLWVADRVDEVLQQYRGEHDIQAPWPTRERIVVALSGGPEGETLIRRGARLVSRAAGGELMAVHVSRSEGALSKSVPEELTAQRALVEKLGGSYHVVVGEDSAQALLDFAHGVNATQVIVGESRRSRLMALFARGVGSRIVEQSGDNLDVYVVTHAEAARGRLLRGGRAPLRRRSALSLQRRMLAWVTAFAAPLLLTAVLATTRDLHSLPIELLLYLTMTVAVSLVGGLWPAVISAVLSSQLVGFFFVPPLHTLAIKDPVIVVDLFVFVLVAGAVATVVDRAARTTQQANRARAEADALNTVAGSILSGQDALPAMLKHAQETFGMSSVTLFERTEDDRDWRCIAFVGDDPATTPEDATVAVPMAARLTLALRGRTLPADQRRVLSAFTAQASQVFERERLREQATDAARLAEGDRIRNFLLAAVSHDLKRPVATIKGAVTSLGQRGAKLPAAERTKLLSAIEESSERLDRLVSNLRDMSRLQAKSVEAITQEIPLAEAVAEAQAAVPGTADIKVDIPGDMPAVLADRDLLVRVLANVLENAIKHTPAGTPVKLSAGPLEEHAEIRVADRGPGVLDQDKERMFQPFESPGEASTVAGVGLGLAVARGFAETMDGTLTAEDTPGGGLTIVLTLPCLEMSEAETPEHQDVAS